MTEDKSEAVKLVTDWIHRGFTAVLALFVGVAGWIFSVQIARIDALESRVVMVEREQAVQASRMESLPTLERIRVVIREEIDRALNQPSHPR